MKTTITITPEEATCGIVQLFDNITTKLYGKNYCSYDCTKICVGKEVFNKVEEYYRTEKNMPKEEFAMLWCCFGPKATLDGYEVEVEDDWCDDEVN